MRSGMDRMLCLGLTNSKSLCTDKETMERENSTKNSEQN